MHTLTGAATFSERLDQNTLFAAKLALVNRVGEHLPAHHIDAPMPIKLSLDLPLSTDSAFLAQGASGRPEVLLARYQTMGSGQHVAAEQLNKVYTHAKFNAAVEASQYKVALDVALPVHLANKIAPPLWGKGRAREETLRDGTNLMKAFHQIENKVGESTLLKAYFAGDDTAIRKVSEAIVDALPKIANPVAWHAIDSVCKKPETQSLAECFVGAALLHEGKVPNPNAYRGRLRRGSQSDRYLPVHAFTDITAKQQKDIKAQAAQVRQRVGAPQFDQAFYNFDAAATQDAMTAVRDDVQKHWNTVLS